MAPQEVFPGLLSPTTTTTTYTVAAPSTTIPAPYRQTVARVHDHEGHPGLLSHSQPHRQAGLYTPPEEMATGVAVNAYPYQHPGDFEKPSYGPQWNQTRPPPDARIGQGKVGLRERRQQQPPSLTNQVPDNEGKGTRGSDIVGYLQIPSSINNSKGSLADFTAQITCLFWFETTGQLKLVNDQWPQSALNPPTSASSPSIGFQKWVTTMLATTQVSQNVILLALLFIYRLKSFNPGVKGKRGSEFRLMTIALMMGNKFLDDNTYTNKTWAEVSGISVQEIHVMEVEFLSNIRYNLFVSEEEWIEWHRQLGTFSDYLDRASQISRSNDKSATMPALQLSPCSTPTTPYTADCSPLSAKAPTLSVTDYTAAQQPSWNQTTPQPPISLPANVRPEPIEPPGTLRKRSRDEETELHPPKRLASSSSAAPNQPAPITHLPPINQPTNLRHPLHITTSLQPAAQAPPAARPGPVSEPGVQLAMPPMTSSMGPNPFTFTSQPLLPNVSALPAGYPATTTSWSQQPTFVSNSQETLLAPPQPNGPEHPRMIPSPAAVSPSLHTYPVHTPPINLSPAAMFLDRNSPYRPVRHVNRLLYPPPSTSLRGTRKLSTDQIHYQPLSKAAREQRRGVLPSYQPDQWAQPLPHAHFPEPSQHNGFER